MYLKKKIREKSFKFRKSLKQKKRNFDLLMKNPVAGCLTPTLSISPKPYFLYSTLCIPLHFLYLAVCIVKNLMTDTKKVLLFFIIVNQIFSLGRTTLINFTLFFNQSPQYLHITRKSFGQKLVFIYHLHISQKAKRLKIIAYLLTFQMFTVISSNIIWSL